VHLNVHAARRVSGRTARSIALTGLIIVFSHDVAAQAPATRWWANLGAGAGKSGPANSTGQDQFSGPTGDVAIGATMTSRGLIGLEVAGWRKSTPLGPSRSVFVSLTLIGYPLGSVLDNVFFQAGLGVGNGSFPTFKTSNDTPSHLNVTRPSLQVALGYDIPIACPVWITPFFQSYGTIGGKRITTGVPTGQHESANGILFHAGISLRYVHPGPAGRCRQRGPALGQ
jgi:hypothetical protein